MAICKRYGKDVVSDDPNYDAVSHSIVIDVLDGLSYVQAGEKYGMSGPAAFKRFWLMRVNRPFKNILPESAKNIKDLRKSWNDFHRSNFDEMED